MTSTDAPGTGDAPGLNEAIAAGAAASGAMDEAIAAAEEETDALDTGTIGGALDAAVAGGAAATVMEVQLMTADLPLMLSRPRVLLCDFMLIFTVFDCFTTVLRLIWAWF